MSLNHKAVSQIYKIALHKMYLSACIYLARYSQIFHCFAALKTVIDLIDLIIKTTRYQSSSYF